MTTTSQPEDREHPQVRYIAAAVDDEYLVTGDWARLHTTPADARSKLDDLGDGYDWRVFEVREPSVATPDTRDRLVLSENWRQAFAHAEADAARNAGMSWVQRAAFIVGLERAAELITEMALPAATPSPVAEDGRDAAVRLLAEQQHRRFDAAHLGWRDFASSAAENVDALIAAGWRPAVATPDTQDVEQLRRDLEQAIYDRDRARKDCRRTRVALLPLLPELAVQNAKATLRAGYVAEEAAQEFRRLRDVAIGEQAQDADSPDSETDRLAEVVRHHLVQVGIATESLDFETQGLTGSIIAAGLLRPAVATSEQAVQRAKQAIRATREWQAGVAFGVPDTGMDQHAEALARAALRAAQGGGGR